MKEEIETKSILKHTLRFLGDEPRHGSTKTGRGVCAFQHNLSPMGFSRVMSVKFLSFFPL